HGSVAISSTDSISSGLTSPTGASPSSDSIALTRFRLSASRIISSSSTPTVRLEAPKLWSTAIGGVSLPRDTGSQTAVRSPSGRALGLLSARIPAARAPQDPEDEHREEH